MSNEPESAAAGKAGGRGEPGFTIGVEEEFQSPTLRHAS